MRWVSSYASCVSLNGQANLASRSCVQNMPFQYRNKRAFAFKITGFLGLGFSCVYAPQRSLSRTSWGLDYLSDFPLSSVCPFLRSASPSASKRSKYASSRVLTDVLATIEPRREAISDLSCWAAANSMRGRRARDVCNAWRDHT